MQMQKMGGGIRKVSEILNKLKETMINYKITTCILLFT